MSKIQDNPKTSVSAPTSAPPAPPRPPREADEPAREVPPARRAGTDTSLVAARPEAIADQQRRLVEAVRAKQANDRRAAEGGEPAPAGAATFTPPRPAATEDLPDMTTSPSKKVLDGVMMGDGAREGVRIVSSLDELNNLPVVGRAVSAAERAAEAGHAVGLGGRLLEGAGKLFRWFPTSPVGQVVQRVVTSAAGRTVARLAPGVGVAIAGFDAYDAIRTSRNPRATGTEKTLATTKAILSGISGAAGVAAVALAPTGAGGAVAGGIALVAGLSAAGIDFFLSRERASART
jgi:hypothetical protein